MELYSATGIINQAIHFHLDGNKVSTFSEVSRGQTLDDLYL